VLAPALPEVWAPPWQDVRRGPSPWADCRGGDDPHADEGAESCESEGRCHLLRGKRQEEWLAGEANRQRKNHRHCRKCFHLRGSTALAAVISWFSELSGADAGRVNRATAAAQDFGKDGAAGR